MEFQFITTDVVQGVATITLNRPDVLNSIHRPMSREVRACLETFAADRSVRAVLLTGAGRGFCAGQDLAEVVAPDGKMLVAVGDIVRESYNPLIRAIRKLEKPVIAAVNGVAAGAGANLALACDIVIASTAASFIQSFSKIGLIPDSGGTFYLPRLIGTARATALMMLGDKLSATDAVSIGLIYKTSPAEALMDEARALATRLAQMPTRGLGLTKRALDASYGQDLEGQLDTELTLQAEAGKTRDFREGVQAFLQKRTPEFTGE
jgi:2-(1,2-epoxy-1,2-dihydrophenyl)acetyl-CoA isomerase